VSAIIRVNNLKAYYIIEESTNRYYIHAVDGISLLINKNEIVGIAGESGCGKSTLLKALYGLIKPPLTILDGSITYNINDKDINILTLNQKALNELRWVYFSYIPQGSMNVLNPILRIKDQFLDIIKAHRKDISKEEAKELIEKHITELGLPLEVLTSFPHQLSGGMRQRVVIALATILRPKVIFADEPTTALDVVVQRGVLQLLRRIQQEMKNTIVLVTHDMGVQAHIAHRIVIMYAGKILEIAPTKEIFKNPLHPYTRYLINSLPRIGDKSKRVSIGGKPPSLRNPPPGCRFHPRCPFAKDICKNKVPQLLEVDNNHYVACHMFG